MAQDHSGRIHQNDNMKRQHPRRQILRHHITIDPSQPIHGAAMQKKSYAKKKQKKKRPHHPTATSTEPKHCTEQHANHYECASDAKVAL
jgi:hypothetical protein